jgi:rhodanese-related sulfurtransferase
MRISFTVGAAAVALVTAFALMLVGMPDTERRLAWLDAELNEELSGRAYHIDPGELLSLMYNNKILLILIDVRDETDFNLFHLKDARWRPVDQMTESCCRRLAAEGVKVVISNDEERANRAWKHLRAKFVPNVYILAGGMNLWVEIYRDESPGPPHEEITGEGDDVLRHEFPVARGHDHPASLPDPELLSKRTFPSKVKVLRPVSLEGGGCG